MNDLVENLPAIGSAPLLIAGLVVAFVVRKIVLGLWLIGAGLILGAVAFFLSQR
ncbi:MAG TPA: hypothetical protein VNA14_02155 [Mycobacteriales bacterium]|nr:hypothetical protein [Mycobacteriales bacterium]